MPALQWKLAQILSTRRATGLKIHEYQAKQILAKYGVADPLGGGGFTPS